MGAYGVTAELGEQLDVKHHVATGGTLFGNPLSAAAAVAALTEVLLPAPTRTPPPWAATSRTESRRRSRRPACRGPRSGWGRAAGSGTGPGPAPAREAYALTDEMLTRLIRIWLANRGIWEALPGAGPTVPVPATRADVDRYLAAYAELLAELR